jgi:hypothetical protein
MVWYGLGCAAVHLLRSVGIRAVAYTGGSTQCSYRRLGDTLKFRSFRTRPLTVAGATLVLAIPLMSIVASSASSVLAYQAPPRVAPSPVVTPNCSTFVPTPPPAPGAPPFQGVGPGTGCGVTPAPSQPGRPCVLTGHDPFQSCPPDPRRTPAPLNCSTMAIGAREQVPACRDYKRGGYR